MPHRYHSCSTGKRWPDFRAATCSTDVETSRATKGGTCGFENWTTASTLCRGGGGVRVYYRVLLYTSSRNGANPRPGISRGRAHPRVTTPMPRDKCSSASFARFSETAARICSRRCEGRASDRISKAAHVGAIAWLVRLSQVLSLGHERFLGGTRRFNGLSSRPRFAGKFVLLEQLFCSSSAETNLESIQDIYKSTRASLLLYLASCSTHLSTG